MPSQRGLEKVYHEVKRKQRHCVKSRDVEAEAQARKTCRFRFHIGYLT